MKRFWFLFSAALVLLFVQSAFGQTDDLPDTVWTKFTYPAEVRAVKFTPDGKYLATGGSDAIPKLWNSETGELVKEFPGRPTGIWNISIANNMIAFIGPLENGIQIYDLNSYELIKSLQGSETGEFSFDGKYLVTGRNSGISVIDLKTWEEIKRIDFDRGSYDIRISKDNKYIARSSHWSSINNDNKEGKIEIYSLPDLKLQSLIEKQEYLGCNNLNFSPSNEFLAGAITASPNKVWNIADWKLFKEFGKDALSVMFSPDNKYVIMGENGFKQARVSIWDVTLGIETFRYRLDWLAKKHLNMDEGDNPYSIDVSYDSKKIAVAGSVGIYMLNAKWNPTSVHENPVQITEPLIFPNPTNQTANIRFNLIKPAQLSISIYDISSIKVAGIFDGFIESGLHNYEWNISGFPSGTYFARITAQGATSTVKIIVNK